MMPRRAMQNKHTRTYLLPLDYRQFPARGSMSVSRPWRCQFQHVRTWVSTLWDISGRCGMEESPAVLRCSRRWRFHPPLHRHCRQICIACIGAINFSSMITTLLRHWVIVWRLFSPLVCQSGLHVICRIDWSSVRRRPTVFTFGYEVAWVCVFNSCRGRNDISCLFVRATYQGIIKWKLCSC